MLWLPLLLLLLTFCFSAVCVTGVSAVDIAGEVIADAAVDDNDEDVEALLAALLTIMTSLLRLMQSLLVLMQSLVDTGFLRLPIKEP